MKRLWGIVMASALIAMLSACGGGGGGNQATPPANNEQPAADKPATDQPAADKPATDQPATDKPAETAPTPAGGNTTYDAATAEATYKNNCASCHGQNLEGMAGPSLTKAGSKYSKDQILAIIEKGKGGMPPGMAKGAEADAVAAWLADKK